MSVCQVHVPPMQGAPTKLVTLFVHVTLDIVTLIMEPLVVSFSGCEVNHTVICSFHYILQPVIMVKFVWWMVHSQVLMKAEWKFATITLMELFVMTSLMKMLLLLFVGEWQVSGMSSVCVHYVFCSRTDFCFSLGALGWPFFVHHLYKIYTYGVCRS